MKIRDLEMLQVDGGMAVFAFLKVTTDQGLVGWAEFSQPEQLAGIIRAAGSRIIGRDPRNLNDISALLFTLQRPMPGGAVSRAAGAIMNACLDIKAKALGVPVYELLGGALRTRLRVYWSHCALFRTSFPDLFENVIGKPAVRSLDDVKLCAREAAAAGFTAIKSNLLRFDGGRARSYGPGIGRGSLQGHPELNIDANIIGAFSDQLAALREGAGSGVELMFDLNHNYKTEGFRKLARASEPFDLTWLEMDMPSPANLAIIRRDTITPIASLEKVMGRTNLTPFLQANAVDVAIIDAQWNGVPEAMKMAAMIDAYDVNVAAHCASGPLGALMSAHFCAAIPNFRIMEYEADYVPWAADLLTRPNQVEGGEFVLTTGAGWGADIVEDVARAHDGGNGPSGKRA